jgi:cyclopropane-fatty-acyl-phospholipid synthase
VKSHYEVGNDFYRLWLDRRMVYSCAYFQTGAEDIDAAQEAKLDLLCRKLRLQPNERFLDIGCGWGGLVQFAAERYGVRAVGITVSPAQADMASARIAEAGLSDRCVVKVADYRTLDGAVAFDKVVSVGMFEHVGRDQLSMYFAKAYELLRPGGLFLNHGIVEHPVGSPRAPQHHGVGAWLRRLLWGGGQFIDRYVFPDGELPVMRELIGHGEAAGFEVRDVESLREHYALTLRHWVRRLEAAASTALQLVGHEAYRTWRLYMAASAHAFTSRRIGITQTLFAKPSASGRASLPLTRADIYGA